MALAGHPPVAFKARESTIATSRDLAARDEAVKAEVESRAKALYREWKMGLGELPPGKALSNRWADAEAPTVAGPRPSLARQGLARRVKPRCETLPGPSDQGFQVESPSAAAPLVTYELPRIRRACTGIGRGSIGGPNGRERSWPPSEAADGAGPTPALGNLPALLPVGTPEVAESLPYTPCTLIGRATSLEARGLTRNQCE